MTRIHPHSAFWTAISTLALAALTACSDSRPASDSSPAEGAPSGDDGPAGSPTLSESGTDLPGGRGPGAPATMVTGQPNVPAPATGSPESAPPGLNYGDERISFKRESSDDEAQGSEDAASPEPFGSTGASPSDPNAVASGGSSSSPAGFAGSGLPSEPEPVPVPEPVEPPIAADGGSDSPMADAGPEDAGLTIARLAADAGVVGANPVALQPENPFRITESMAASTFSIDVDSGSYTLARAALNQGVLPDPATVRIEEFINYFHLHYEQPPAGVPFSVYSELGACPWAPEHQLMLVGIQGEEVPLVDQPAANLVFLLDVSGSMDDPNKLPLLKKGFRMLARQLRPIDKVSIVTYASSDTVVIEGVSGSDTDTILYAIDQLEAGGSTNGEGGIQRAYTIAQEHFIEGGNNRVLLATDGDFNVGLSNTEELAAFISEKRDTGVFLSVFGFGSPTGNFMDPTAEQLADNGNGIYFFIDGPEEARRAFVETATGALLTVAKDVKLQLEYNPALVAGYRLIGYENRVLLNSDFSNDFVDAGELGASLSVTALFEIIPAGAGLSIPTAAPGTDPLEGLPEETDTEAADADAEFEPVTGQDLVELRIRYKGRDANLSELLTSRYAPADIERTTATLKFTFASAVAELGMQLRGSQYLPVRRTSELYDQISLALPAAEDGSVDEFLGLAKAAHGL